ncbi:hypothetical protein ACAN107058_21090 [Paracidovorax anthurii]
MPRWRSGQPAARIERAGRVGRGAAALWAGTSGRSGVLAGAGGLPSATALRTRGRPVHGGAPADGGDPPGPCRDAGLPHAGPGGLPHAGQRPAAHGPGPCPVPLERPRPHPRGRGGPWPRGAGPRRGSLAHGGLVHLAFPRGPGAAGCAGRCRAAREGEPARGAAQGRGVWRLAPFRHAGAAAGPAGAAPCAPGVQLPGPVRRAPGRCAGLVAGSRAGRARGGWGRAAAARVHGQWPGARFGVVGGGGLQRGASRCGHCAPVDAGLRERAAGADRALHPGSPRRHAVGLSPGGAGSGAARWARAGPGAGGRPLSALAAAGRPGFPMPA